jgi:hypothetical protein
VDFGRPVDRSSRGGVVAVLVISGAVSTILGVAGGELIIPTPVLLFGVPIQGRRDHEPVHQHSDDACRALRDTGARGCFRR